MLYIDLKYLRLVSHRLPLFKQKSENKFNARCVLCGDSQTKKNKARGYFYPQDNSIRYKCHNCGISMGFSYFLKQLDSNLYNDYALETYGDRNAKSNATIKLEYSRPAPEPVVDAVKEPDLLSALLPRLDTLDDDNEAVQFCLKRQIPRAQFHNLYFVDDVRKIEQLSPRYRDTIRTSEPRLVLPFYDHKLQLSGITCRALRGESLRYLTLKVKENAPLIFGLDRLNMRKRILVVEGPIDSLFLENCIAVAGTAFNKVHELGLPNLTVIFDNQPRNPEVMKLMGSVVRAGKPVVIWPDEITAKDVNDMVLAGLDVQKIIDTHTYSGLEAQLRFTGYKKC